MIGASNAVRRRKTVRYQASMASKRLARMTKCASFVGTMVDVDGETDAIWFIESPLRDCELTIPRACIVDKFTIWSNKTSAKKAEALATPAKGQELTRRAHA